ncbi:MAG TPA: hypothetical protein VFX49_11050 [Chloroflexota bacterium]|nr:hypothetical protein [Chloroflexota bacterium]
MAHQPRSRRTGWFSWWVALGPTLVWRLPLLLAFALLGFWFVFRGLVRMSFIFAANQVLSFVFAPLLLPLAALPAICVYLALRTLPRVWREATTNDGTKTLNTVLIFPVTLLVATFVDFVETVAVLRMGIRLPRLPFDLF